MPDKILNKILSHSKKAKGLIGIRKYSEDGEYYVGYIVDYNETFIAFQHVTKYGLEDGLYIEQIKNIESFETDDEYGKSYQALFNNNIKIESQTVKSLVVPQKKSWQHELLKSKFDKGKIITIGLDDETIIHGYVVSYDETYLYLNLIGSLGEDEGKNLYKLDDIAAFSVDILESRKRAAFHKRRSRT
jgi:hypothetical protein